MDCDGLYDDCEFTELPEGVEDSLISSFNLVLENVNSCGEFGRRVAFQALLRRLDTDNISFIEQKILESIDETRGETSRSEYVQNLYGFNAAFSRYLSD